MDLYSRLMESRSRARRGRRGERSGRDSRVLYHVGNAPAIPRPAHSRAARETVGKGLEADTSNEGSWQRAGLPPTKAGVFLTNNPHRVALNHGVFGHVYAYRVPEHVIRKSGGIKTFDHATELLVPHHLWHHVKFLGKQQHRKDFIKEVDKVPARVVEKGFDRAMDVYMAKRNKEKNKQMESQGSICYRRTPLLLESLIESDEEIQSLIQQANRNPGDRDLQNRVDAKLRRVGRHQEADERITGPFVKAYEKMRLARALYRQRKKKPDAEKHKKSLKDAEADMWYAADDAHEATPHGNPGLHLRRESFGSDREHVKALAHLHKADALTIDPAGGFGSVEFTKAHRHREAADDANRFIDSFRHHYADSALTHYERPHQPRRVVRFTNNASTDVGPTRYHDLPEKP